MLVPDYCICYVLSNHVALAAYGGGALQLGGGAVAPPWPTVEAGRGRPRGCQTVDAGKAEGGRGERGGGGGGGRWGGGGVKK